MLLKPKSTGRRTGAIVPMVAISLVGMMGMLALAIDLGTMAIARNQCQAIADASALGACRALNGNAATNNNSAGALSNGQAIALQNNILGQQVTGAQVQLTIGDYYYQPSSQSFMINPTGLSSSGANYPPDNYCLAQAQVTYQGKGFFSNIWSTAPYNTQATATSAHSPRDVSIIQDFSGSMRYDSWLGNFSGNGRNQSQNPDTITPTWGQYATGTCPGNFLQFTSDVLYAGSGVCGQCNYTTTTNDGPPIVNDYSYATTAFSATPVAWNTSGSYWSPLTMSPSATASAGDQPPSGQTVKSITGGSTWNLNWELDGYSGIGSNAVTSTATDYSNSKFNGYTVGPGYWGKTFFIWPPDPRVPWDSWYYGGNGANIQSVVCGFVANMFNGGNQPVKDSGLEGIYKSNGFSGSKNWPGSAGSGEWVNSGAMATYINGLPASAFPGSVKPANLSTLVAQMQRLFNRGGKINNVQTTAPGMPIMNVYQNNAAPNTPAPCDWRARFFYNGNQSGPMAGNNDIFTSSGNLQSPSINTSTPSSAYQINYAAILDWIMNAGKPGAGDIFPPQIRLGGLLYYNSIPGSGTNNAPNINLYQYMPWSGSGLGSVTANDAAQPKCDAAFWQTYIDAVLGYVYTGGSATSGLSYDTCVNGTYADFGYRNDYQWGTTAASGRPQALAAYTQTTSTNVTATQYQYMSYTDNPYRGGTKYWFGPLTFADVTTKFPGYSHYFPDGTFSWTSGTAHEAPTFQCKLGIQGALKDMQKNHPNDMVSLQFFSTAGTYYNYSKMPLSRNYNLGVNSEWFSAKMIGNGSSFTEITPFSYTSGVGEPDVMGIPRANGSTNFEFPCELAFNQFSSNTGNITFTPSPAPSGTSGGLGRVGATKLLVFETDGQINEHNNQSPSSLFVGGANCTSYYKVRCTNYNGNGTLEGSGITVGGDNVTISATPSDRKSVV